ncbi:hypothetical protein HUK48_07400 [Prevotella corporis]|uniref:Uncharacterized protein n=2 Tax=Prevotellaceae TaxID=171552 RepID=A0A5C8GLU0_9BACT|nr:hypothetical protein [Prevotella brunnea]MDQ7737222.1 hypothetical protein [Prevotella corporis]MDR0187132.1 hypothetical protein [Prevotella brunnea]TXJ62734.1 hypothetical protein ETF27_03265 [Prevotella brunnea]
MKKVIEFIVLGVVFFVLVLLYIIYDRTGYHYGLECSFCNKNMPYGLTPKINSDYPQSFVLLDEDGFELTGSGFRHRQSSFKIKNFLGYGYNDTSVLLKCTDSLNNIKYLVSYEIGYKSDKENPVISFKDINYNEYSQIKNNYQWIKIDEEKANTIQIMKFLFIVGALLSLFFIVRKLLRFRGNASNQELLK